MKKVYSVAGVGLGTFIGGPLTGGYLLSRNFAAMGRSELVRPTLFAGFLATLCLVSIFTILPEEVVNAVPQFIIPLLTAFLARHLYLRHQKESIDQLVEEEAGTPTSNWKVVGISLLFAIFTYLLGLGIIFLRS